MFVSRDQRNGLTCLHIIFSRPCPHRLEWPKLPFSSVLLIFHGKTQILEFKGKHSSKWWILRMKGTLCLAYGPQKQVCVSQLKAKQWFIWSRVFLLSPEALDTSRVTRKQAVIKGWKDSPWVNYFSILSVIFILSKPFLLFIPPPYAPLSVLVFIFPRKGAEVSADSACSPFPCP